MVPEGGNSIPMCDKTVQLLSLSLADIRPLSTTMESTPLLWAFLLVLSIYQVNTKDSWSGRTWQSNLNYNNSRNWNIGREPCDTDRVILQRSESIVLEIPGGTTSIRGLVLPSYAEIMLPKNGEIQFTGKKTSATCDGQDAVFKPTSALRWTDAQNWDKWSQATPDLERIPCTSDAVRFPAGATFRVLMPDVVKLGSLEMNGASIDTMDWFKFSNYGEGVRQFFKADGDSADLEINVSPCPSSQWCQCGNEYLRSKICTSTCPLPLCKQPVQPSGFCCPFCGAYFLLRSISQNKRELNEHINLFVSGKGVVWHTSRVKEYIQVVLVEEGEYSGEVPDVAEHLKTSLINSGMGWIAEEFHASGHVWYPTTFGQVVEHFLSLMVFAALTIAVIVVFYSQNWSWFHLFPLEGRPFVFARFENQSGEVVVSSDLRQHSPVMPQAFDNPMYGATGQEQRNITVENPVYTELEETSNRGPIEQGTILDSTDFSE